MPIQVLPPQRTGLQEFTEAFSPYLQMAFQTMLQKKMEEEAYQRNIQRANQMFPGVFQPTPQMEQAPGLVGQYATSQGQIPTKPAIPKQYQFNMEQTQQYPGLGMDLTTGGMEYKVPQPLAPTYVYNPSTGAIEPLKLPTGEPISPKSKVITKPESPEAKQVREVETTKQKKAAEIGAESQAVDNMATTVWQAADKLIPAPTEPAQAERLGMERRLKTTGIGGWRPQRMFGISDEDALAFDQIKRGEATPLIRALGEKGMLTNQDIERAYNLMPHFSDTKRLRNTKKEELTKFLKSRVNAYYQQTEQPQTDSEYQKYLNAVGGQ